MLRFRLAAAGTLRSRSAVSTFSRAVEKGKEVKRLKHKTETSTTNSRQITVRKRAHLTPGKQDHAGGRTQDTAEHREQGGFALNRGDDQRDFTGSQRERDALDRGDGDCSLLIIAW